MDNSISNLAEFFSVAPERLIEMLTEAGVEGKGVDDDVTFEEKAMLLKLHRTGKFKLNQRRKSQDMEVRDSGGNKRKITVNVQQKAREVMTAEAYRRRQKELAEQSGEEEEKEEEIQVDGVVDVTDAPAEETEVEKQPVEAEGAPDPESDETSQQEESVEAAEPEESAQEEPSETETVEAPPAVSPAVAPVAPTEEPKRKSKSKRKGARSDPDGQLHLTGKARKRRRRQPARNRELNEQRAKEHGFQAPTQPTVHEVSIAEHNPVSKLAAAMSVKAADLIGALMRMGIMTSINESIDADTATLVVEEMGHVPVEAVSHDFEAELLGNAEDDREQQARPPVVAVMGHVDHGKTTLLDYIRTTQVAASEKGGITQRIGAYRVETSKGAMTFLDTPGHEAFAAMRIRGAKVADIVILVVAADDGVKPQTVEAINHAKSAEVPVIVAINKMDKSKSAPEVVGNELVNHEIVIENLGGTTQSAEVSALKGTGVDKLLELVTLEAELLDLMAPASGVASGVVVESRVDKGRGPVATVLVQKGVLSKGDMVVSGLRKGRARALTDDRGSRVGSATPSVPLEIEGLDGVPDVGAEFICVPDEKTAQKLVDLRKSQTADRSVGPMGIEFSEDQSKVLNLVIKADVQGSAEAMSDALSKLTTDEVEVKVIHEMVGGISKSDVSLAIPAKAIIIAYNVRADSAARKLIDEHKVAVYNFAVIYDAIEAVKEIIDGISAPKIVEQVIGRIEVRELFKFAKVGTIAGCYIHEGAVRRNLPVRVLRDDIVVHDGIVDSLKRFKSDVQEVKAGFECGIGLKNYHDIQANDWLEIYQQVEA